MTDKDIIKALECCIEMQCTKCPMNYDDCEERDFDSLVKRAIQVFNRQKAEIEHRKKHKKVFDSLYDDLLKDNKRLKENNKAIMQTIADVRTEAIKEFAERLKEQRHTLLPPIGYPIDENDWIVHREDIDDVEKEMLGELK